MKEEIKNYLDSVISYSIIKNDNYDLLEFKLKFDKYEKNASLYIGNESLKLTIICECPICNMDVFIEMNEFNHNSDLFKAYHYDDNLYLECYMFYSNLNDIKDIFNTLRYDDYEYILALLNVVDKVNKIDKAELLGDVMSILSGGNNE